MRVRIHRGAREIGGSCVELQAAGESILLDLGRPLWATPDEQVRCHRPSVWASPAHSPAR
ncbi:hypothetical protein ACFQX7_28070 [Luedemannella flava]